MLYTNLQNAFFGLFSTEQELGRPEGMLLLPILELWGGVLSSAPSGFKILCVNR